jgi:hypothetical protein
MAFTSRSLEPVSVTLVPLLGARNQVGIGLSYRPASLCSLLTQFQTRFLESIPRPIVGLKFSTQESNISENHQNVQIVQSVQI